MKAYQSKSTAVWADEIIGRMRRLKHRSAEPMRALRKEYTRLLAGAPRAFMIELAGTLIRRSEEIHRFFPCELVFCHREAMAAITLTELERLGKGIDSWDKVDSLCLLTGTAWREGRLSDAAVKRWAKSKDRWWRRAALVSTTPLNLRSHGATGDARRTLMICEMLVDDHDDMIYKALSWALRELVHWDRKAVEAFLRRHDDVLHARVKREVRNKLRTGVKNPKRRTGA